MSEKSVAERLREVAYTSCNANNITKAVFGESISCPPNMICDECFTAVCDKLADAIEAEQAELQKCIEVLESDKDDYIESVTTFAYWQMQTANMLDIPHAERNDSEEVQAKIIAALKERIKTEHDGANDLTNDLNEGDVDVDALLKPQLPEGIEWPRFEDGELVRFGDKFINGSGCVSTLYNLHFYDDEVHLNLSDFFKYGEPVKRPEPEVLDADGAPIKVGDTVWYEGREWRVSDVYVCSDGEGGVNLESFIKDEFDEPVEAVVNAWNKHVTHRKPDTFEGVVAEMLADFDGADSIELDGYFDRLRKLLGGE